MSRRHGVPPPPQTIAETIRAEHIRAAWPDVHVDFAETESRAEGWQVRAVIHLGRLAPADVVVRLAPAAEVAAQDWLPEQRMWSSASYDNGCFLFERSIPRAEGADGAVADWVVAVHPAGMVPGRPVMYPLRVGGSAAVGATAPR